MPEQEQGSIAKAGLAELVGTFLLVFAGTAVVVAAALELPVAGPPSNSLAVGLTFALVLAALVAALGHVSGAHFNPAVTLGLAVGRKFPWSRVVIYWIAQLAGAVLAAAAVWAAFGDPARRGPALGATYPVDGFSLGQVFLMEALVTFLLMFVIMGVATDDRANKAAHTMAIGFALGMAVLIAGPISGGAVNPARALGPMIVAGKFTGWWIYLLAPPLGAAVAAILYNGLRELTSASGSGREQRSNRR